MKVDLHVGLGIIIDIDHQPKFIVDGDTYKYRNELKEAGFEFHRGTSIPDDKSYWIAPSTKKRLHALACIFPWKKDVLTSGSWYETHKFYII